MKTPKWIEEPMDMTDEAGKIFSTGKQPLLADVYDGIMIALGSVDTDDLATELERVWGREMASLIAAEIKNRLIYSMAALIEEVAVRTDKKMKTK